MGWLRRRLDDWEAVSLALFLVACSVLSFFQDVLPRPDDTLRAALFAAFLFTLREVRGARHDIQALKPTTDAFLRNPEEFYTSLRDSVRRGKVEIRATYFRPVPPASLGGGISAEYFRAVEEFARSNRPVRRIIGVSNEQMAVWCASQEPTCAAIPNYNIRVIVTTDQKVEPMSMAMIDDDVMYMAFSGATAEQVGGIREQAPNLVRFHRERFEQLWALGVDLPDFLKSDGYRSLFADR